MRIASLTSTCKTETCKTGTCKIGTCNTETCKTPTWRTSASQTQACAAAGDAGDLFDGEQDDAFAGVGTARPRARRGYGLLKGRRTRFQSKRRTGKLTVDTPVHRGEREIIARN